MKGYINTDLDIISKRDLRKLKEFLEQKSDLLHGDNSAGNWVIRLEANGSGLIDSDDHDVCLDLTKLINLMKEAKSIFPLELGDTDLFDFNIGVQAAEDGVLEYLLPTEKLAQISALGATLSVTTYPPENSSYYGQ